MTDRYPDAPRLALERESTSRDLTAIEHAGDATHTAVPGAGPDDPRRLGKLVGEAAEALSAPRAPCAIVCIEPPGLKPAGPWLAILAAGPDLFAMAEPDGHALLAEMAAGLVTACPGVRALSPVEDLALIVVTLGTEAGRLASFVPLVVTARAAIAPLATDVRPDAALRRAPSGVPGRRPRSTPGGEERGHQRADRRRGSSPSLPCHPPFEDTHQ